MIALRKKVLSKEHMQSAEILDGVEGLLCALSILREIGAVKVDESGSSARTKALGEYKATQCMFRREKSPSMLPILEGVH